MSCATFTQSHQFPGLVVMDRRPPDEHGVAQVLFFAKVFEKGKDRSFVERSDFRHDGTGWRYLSGVGFRPADLPVPPEAAHAGDFSGVKEPPSGFRSLFVHEGQLPGRRGPTRTGKSTDNAIAVQLRSWPE